MCAIERFIHKKDNDDEHSENIFTHGFYTDDGK